MQIYVIPGEPIALARPRFSLSSKRVYNCQRNSMNSAAIYLQTQHKGPMFNGAIHLDVTFYFKFPKHWSKAKRIAGTFKDSKSDLSNLVKFVEDIAIGILYDDDAIIASISARKVYDIEARTEFKIQIL